MTNNIYKGICLAALTVALAACQNDVVESNQAVDSKSGSMITIGCSIGTNTVASRAQIVLGGDTDIEYGQWNEGDSFTLYNVGDGYSEISDVADFTIYGYSDDDPSSSASFTGENIVAEGDSVIAFYPAQEDLGGDIIGVTIDQITNMDANTEDDIKEYMASNMYMYAINQIEDTDDISLTFEHLTSMARITYTNRTDTVQNISTVIIEGDDEYFGTSMEYYLFEINLDGTKYFVTDSSSFLTQIFNDLTVAAEESVDFYFLFFPSSDFDDSGTITITINDESVEMNTSDISTTCFEAGYRYWFDVAKTDDELIWAKDYVDYVIIYSSVNATLCEVLANMLDDVTLDEDGNALVPLSVIKNTTSLNLNRQSLDSLEGLECFVNLQYLYCAVNNLTSLDVSFCPNLNYLSCQFNSITELDVSGFQSLSTIECESNALTTLDASNCTALTELNCQSNSLEELNVLGCTNLSVLKCQFNQLTSLDLSSNMYLTELQCSNNDLTTLDVSNHTLLSELGCWCETIKSIDVSCCTSLEQLSVSETDVLECVDCSDCTSLVAILLYENNLSTLTLTNCTALTNLQCNKNALTNLDLSTCSSLTYLRCAHNDLVALDLSSLVYLYVLNCDENELTSLDISNCPLMISVSCAGNHLNSLDITNQPDMTSLSCGSQTDVTGETINMILYLTEAQLEMWNDKWCPTSSTDSNQHISVSVVY